MEKGLVSIVLPIYNVENYLDRCVRSVISQSYKRLEIILVDDGSLDSCPQKCDEWAKMDNRIKVVHKKNAGLGYARNTGIENASGEYICFFDSDDYIAADTIEKAYAAAVSQNCDMILFGHHDVNAQGKIVKTYIPKTKKKCYIGSEIQNELLPELISADPISGESSNLWLSAWCSLYSMQMIVDCNWRFVSERDIISEDVYSLLCLYKNVKRAAIIPEAFYYYCENSTSLTHSYRKDRFSRIKFFYRQCLDICEKLGYNAEIKRRLAYPFISNTIAAMKMLVVEPESKKEKATDLKEIINDEALQEILHEIPLDKEKATRKLLLNLMKRKMYKSCYFLLKLKTKR